MRKTTKSPGEKIVKDIKRAASLPDLAVPRGFGETEPAIAAE